MNRLLPLSTVLTLSACVGTSPVPSIDRAAPPFTPIAFFAGRTEGVGRLEVALSGARTVRVESMGKVGSDGTLTLAQRIAEEGKAVRTRTWSLRPTTSGAYEGTLSDAVGAVVANVDGNRLHIRFKARAGVDVEQWLTLQPGGRLARNHLVARKFGVRVAVLDETITKRH